MSEMRVRVDIGEWVCVATFARRWAEALGVRGCRQTSEVFRDFGSLGWCSPAGSGRPRSGERGYGCYRPNQPSNNRNEAVAGR